MASFSGVPPTDLGLGSQIGVCDLPVLAREPQHDRGFRCGELADGDDLSGFDHRRENALRRRWGMNGFAAPARSW